MTDLPPLSQVLTLDCSNIQWITPVYGFLGSTINQSVNQSDNLRLITTEWSTVLQRQGVPFMDPNDSIPCVIQGSRSSVHEYKSSGI